MGQQPSKATTEHARLVQLDTMYWKATGCWTLWQSVLRRHSKLLARQRPGGWRRPPAHLRRNTDKRQAANAPLSEKPIMQQLPNLWACRTCASLHMTQIGHCGWHVRVTVRSAHVQPRHHHPHRRGRARMPQRTVTYVAGVCVAPGASPSEQAAVQRHAHSRKHQFVQAKLTRDHCSSACAADLLMVILWMALPPANHRGQWAIRRPPLPLPLPPSPPSKVHQSTSPCGDSKRRSLPNRSPLWTSPRPRPLSLTRAPARGSSSSRPGQSPERHNEFPAGSSS